MTTKPTGRPRKDAAPSAPSLSAAAHGTRRELLEAMRDYLAAALDASPPVREIAPLLRRLGEVTRDLDGLPDEADVSPADKLAREREARRAAARAAAEGHDPVTDGDD